MWTRTLIPLFTVWLYFSPVSATEWGTYTNKEYNFKVDYPLNTFVRRRAAADGNGITMETENGSTEFRAYAFKNEANLSLKAVQKIILKGNDGRKITYKRAKKNWIVISGYERDGKQRLIFYQRLAASKDMRTFSAFELTYPIEQRGKIDPLIKRISLSLTAPKP